MLFHTKVRLRNLRVVFRVILICVGVLRLWVDAFAANPLNQSKDAGQFSLPYMDCRVSLSAPVKYSYFETVSVDFMVNTYQHFTNYLEILREDLNALLSQQEYEKIVERLRAYALDEISKAGPSQSGELLHLNLSRLTPELRRDFRNHFQYTMVLSYLRHFRALHDELGKFLFEVLVLSKDVNSEDHFRIHERIPLQLQVDQRVQSFMEEYERLVYSIFDRVYGSIKAPLEATERSRKHHNLYGTDTTPKTKKLKGFSALGRLPGEKEVLLQIGKDQLIVATPEYPSGLILDSEQIYLNLLSGLKTVKVAVDEIRIQRTVLAKMNSDVEAARISGDPKELIESGKLLKLLREIDTEEFLKVADGAIAKNHGHKNLGETPDVFKPEALRTYLQLRTSRE